jgi:hypothetical protein
VEAGIEKFSKEPDGDGVLTIFEGSFFFFCFIYGAPDSKEFVFFFFKKKRVWGGSFGCVGWNQMRIISLNFQVFKRDLNTKKRLSFFFLNCPNY